MEPWLRRRARLTPAAPALVFAGRTTTFAALGAASSGMAARLADHGIGVGDRVAILARAAPATVVAVHALQYLGAVVVPINTRAAPPEVAGLLATIRPAAVAYDRTTHALVPEGVAAIDLDAIDTIGAVAAIDGAGVPRTDAPAEGPMLDPNAVHSMLFTSGTTGQPKAACLTHANHEASAVASARHLELGTTDRWLLCMPLFHVGGLAVVLRSAITGFAVLLHEDFDVAAVDGALRREGATIVSVVPTMLARLLDARPEPYPPSLRVVLTGGGALPPALRRRAEAAAVPIVSTYGLTEAASQVATAHPGRGGAEPLPGTEVRIDRPDAAGVGEILVRGPTVMRGYFEDASATATALADGWLHTGDAGRQSNDGTLTVVGRRTDLIVSGGENVYPAEVERVLVEHPAVAEVAVYGVPDPEWGERVVAAVVGTGATLDAEALRVWGAERLARYKIPRTITIVDALPRTASGKIRRAALRDVPVSGA